MQKTYNLFELDTKNGLQSLFIVFFIFPFLWKIIFLVICVCFFIFTFIFKQFIYFSAVHFALSFVKDKGVLKI